MRMARTSRLNPQITARDGATTGPRSLPTSAKMYGGNITVKPGYSWIHLWSEWDWDNWIKPQVDRAVALGMRGIRLIGAPLTVLGTTVTVPAWAPSFGYGVGFIVKNGGNWYLSTSAGSSASSGGPSGTGASISDGSATWKYLRPDTLTPISQVQYDSQWSQLAQYCATKGVCLYPCLCESDIGALGAYQDAMITASIVATAANLSKFPNVIGFDLFQEGDSRTGPLWLPNTGYSVGNKVSVNGNTYTCTTAGTSALSGSGPSGTASSITDGSVTWSYTVTSLMPADVTALATAIRAVSNVPLTMSLPTGSLGAAWSDYTNLWWLALQSLDFVDVHIYDALIAADDIDYLAVRLGKPILIGEFGASQSQTTKQQTDLFTAVSPIHQRDGVLGSFVWALADQSIVTSGQYGVWDNTGFAQGSSPLSTTSGARASLVDLLRKFTVAQPIIRQYTPPNLAAPSVARPTRNATFPKGGGYTQSWQALANTALVADGRGLGVKCIAGGTATSINVYQTVQPLLVGKSSWYKMIVEVVADSVGRTFDVKIDWFDASKNNIGTSPSTTSTFQYADRVNIPVTLECLVQSPSNAVYGTPTITWSPSQATNEVHILRSFRLELA